MMIREEQKYPIGKYQKPNHFSKEIIEKYISDIESFPSRIRSITEKLTDKELNSTYRPDGWTVRQVVNHCADSHMNSFTRLKLALTENRPVIKPYFEDRWAELEDSRLIPVSFSLSIIEGIHARWTFLLNSLTEGEWEKTFVHPEHGRVFDIKEHTGIYAWHSDHHLAHIMMALKNSIGQL